MEFQAVVSARHWGARSGMHCHGQAEWPPSGQGGRRPGIFEVLMRYSSVKIFLSWDDEYFLWKVSVTGCSRSKYGEVMMREKRRGPNREWSPQDIVIITVATRAAIVQLCFHLVYALYKYLYETVTLLYRRTKKHGFNSSISLFLMNRSQP